MRFEDREDAQGYGSCCYEVAGGEGTKGRLS
jgi:hypothetical protein